METHFLTAYRGLNPKQRQAVDQIEGPVLVVAGPGTGKTQVLTLRVANILRHTDTAPESILTLTFTDAAAHTMRQRLHTLIGAEAYRVSIHTFHGFAGMVIREYPEQFPHIAEGRPARELEQVRVLEAALEAAGARLLRPAAAPRLHVRTILGALSNLKREGVFPDDFAALVSKEASTLADIPQYHESGAHKGKVRSEYLRAQQFHARNCELSAVYRAYEQLLAQEKRYDFDDMLLALLRALTDNHALLRDLQERYHYILADEHQDVNGAQDQVIAQLANYHAAPNVFAVGDEKQSIYRFQGASLENFLSFERTYGETTLITLTENYRSRQAILDTAHELIAVPHESELAPFRAPLNAATAKEGSLFVGHFSHQQQEDEWLAATLTERLAKGVPPEECAVIVRTNREVEQLCAVFTRHGLAVAPSADSDILSHPLTTSLLTLLQVVAAPEDDEAVAALLHAPYLQVRAADIACTLSARPRSVPLLHFLGQRDKLQQAGVADPDAVARLGTLIDTARDYDGVEPAHRVVARVLTESGFLRHAMRIDPHGGMQVVKRIYDEIEAAVRAQDVRTLRDVVALFAHYRAYNLSLTVPAIAARHKAIPVMTAHKAKGLEFDTVFLPHLTDHRWGRPTQRSFLQLPLKLTQTEAANQEDDERRLLYVALTRARKEVVATHSAVEGDGAARSPSRFLDELASHFTPLARNEDAPDTPTLAQFEVHTPPAIDPEVLTTLLATRGMTVTALNNYKKSPWDFVYRNLLRYPEIQSPTLLYGTAVHNVLDALVRARETEGEWPAVGVIEEWLRRELQQAPLTPTEYATLHERGLAALVRYYEHLRLVVPAGAVTEYGVRAAWRTDVAALPEITLSGKLDRIDLTADRTQATQVVDYKTGAHRSRRAMLGHTKSGDKSYYRQLVFYSFLLDCYGEPRYQTRTGSISFVEPNKRGEIRGEQFTVSEDDLEELQADLRALVHDVTSGAILEVPCDPAQSRYCELAAALAAAPRADGETPSPR